MIKQMIDQASFYQEREKKSRESENQVKSQVDGIVMCFAGCVFCLTVFLSTVIVSNISNWLSTHSPVSQVTK